MGVLRRGGRARPPVVTSLVAVTMSWAVMIASALALTLGAQTLGAQVFGARSHAASLLWSDEFSGEAGASPSTANWNWETGGGGWGNNEWQTYTNSRANSYLNGNGQLVIAARATSFTSITSARINTLGKFAITNGTVAARINLPSGQGLLPAFWLMGTDHESAGWPASGEIDVIETPNTGWRYNATLHGPTNSGAHWQNGFGGPTPVDLTADYHTYAITKQQNRIDVTIDGYNIATWTPANLASNQRWVFNKPFYLLLSLAVGGNWPGAPNLSTPNPSYMLLDWIRAYSLS